MVNDNVEPDIKYEKESSIPEYSQPGTKEKRNTRKNPVSKNTPQLVPKKTGNTLKGAGGTWSMTMLNQI
jgi:hypothetical protein